MEISFVSTLQLIFAAFEIELGNNLKRDKGGVNVRINKTVSVLTMIYSLYNNVGPVISSYGPIKEI